MFRIGYAVNGFSDWDRRGMMKGLGNPGQWNGFDFRSPSVLAFDDYTLIAIEAWADSVSPSIGLLVGVERWLKPLQNAVVFNRDKTSEKQLEIGNYGAGNLEVTHFSVSHPAFSIRNSVTPLVLKPAEKLMITIQYQPLNNSPSAGILSISSDSMIENPATVLLLGF